jgi:hypothetical protein
VKFRYPTSTGSSRNKIESSSRPPQTPSASGADSLRTSGLRRSSSGHRLRSSIQGHKLHRLRSSTFEGVCHSSGHRLHHRLRPQLRSGHRLHRLRSSRLPPAPAAPPPAAAAQHSKPQHKRLRHQTSAQVQQVPEFSSTVSAEVLDFNGKCRTCLALVSFIIRHCSAGPAVEVGYYRGLAYSIIDKLDLFVIITRYFTKTHIRYFVTCTSFSFFKCLYKYVDVSCQ